MEASAELYKSPCGAGAGSAEKRDVMALLNTILPPREWRDEYGNLVRQSVSSQSSTGLDAIHLAERLDIRLKQEHARETGICPIRRKLYSECFDELIRQVTIDCTERGILLVTIRDEALATINTYKDLYASVTAHKQRKLLKSESWIVEWLQKYKQELLELDEIESEATARKYKIQSADNEHAAELETLKAKCMSEIEELKNVNQDLKAQVEAIILPKKLKHGLSARLLTTKMI